MLICILLNLLPWLPQKCKLTWLHSNSKPFFYNYKFPVLHARYDTQSSFESPINLDLKPLYFLLLISTGMRLSCSKQLVNPFLMMMMIHLSRLLGVFLLAEFLIQIYESPWAILPIAPSALCWQSYIFGCIILTMPGVVQVVCAMSLFLLVFMSLGVTHVMFLHRRNSVSF